MLPIISPLEHALVIIEFVGYGRTVYFHASRENDQFVPIGDGLQEEIDVRSFMDEEADRMLVDGYS